MEHISQPTALQHPRTGAASNTGPLVIVTILFFMWGLLTALNDVLIPHLKAIYTLTYLQAMRFAIVPQAVRRVIPPLLNEFVILIKDTSLVVILGLPLQQLDLFGAAQQGYSATASATYFVAVSAGYLLITLPMIWIVNRVERRLHSGLVGITAGGA